jgi:spore coat protein U-like protein
MREAATGGVGHGSGTGLFRAGLVLAVGAALAGATSRAAADTDTGQLAVTATVLSGCTLIGGTLDFGNYVSGQPGALDAAGRISYVNCRGTLTFELDGGQAGNVYARQMRGPDGSLGYQIYKTSARNSVWGQGGDAYQLQLLSPTPSSGNVTVHGRIFGGQAVPGGTYTDIVNITLTFVD